LIESLRSDLGAAHDKIERLTITMRSLQDDLNRERREHGKAKDQLEKLWPVAQNAANFYEIEREAHKASQEAARDEIERLKIIIQSLQVTNVSLLESRTELETETIHQIALTDALVEALPKCDRHCGQPATKAFRRGDLRYCDKCPMPMSDGVGGIGHARDYPRADPLRAIQKDRAERAVWATVEHMETSPMVRVDRERGWWQYKCSVCGQIATGSTIYKEQEYDYGTHCGEPWMVAGWVNVDGEK
jgi:hypothetical protein